MLTISQAAYDAIVAHAKRDHPDEACGIVAGPEGSEKEVAARYRELREWFAPIGLEPEAVRLSRRYAWTVRLNNGMSVELGREQSATTLKDRVNRLIGIYPQLAARLQNRMESVDMRYPNGLALKADGLALGLDRKKK